MYVLYVCVYLCVCMYVCTCVYIHTHTHTNACTQALTHAHTHTQRDIHAHACTVSTHPHEVRDRIPLPDDDRAAFVALQPHAQRRPVAAGGGGYDRNAATQTRNAKQSFNSVAKEILPQAAEGMIL
jgi:hypothetical protein